MQSLKTQSVYFKLIFIILVLFVFSSNLISAANKSPDAVAVRVVPNPEHYSALRWYQENAAIQGSPQSLLVDGYEAVRDGRTVYVSAANLSGSTLYTNIYLISYNQLAEPATVDIFGQLLAHWKFNTDLSKAGYCQNNLKASINCPAEACPSGYSCDSLSGNCRIACLSDADCPSGDWCLSDKAKVTRDSNRLARMNDIDYLLKQYGQANGHYPALAAGSYIPHTSLSVWPSWQETLGQELGSGLSVDPINQLADCPGYHDLTCWNEEQEIFAWPGEISAGKIPPNNYAFLYRSDAAGANYTLCAFSETGLIDRGCNSQCLPACIGLACGADQCGGNCPPGCQAGESCGAGQCFTNCTTAAGCRDSLTSGHIVSGYCLSGSCYQCNAGYSWNGSACQLIVIPVCADEDSDGYGVCPNCGTGSGCSFSGNDCNDNPLTGNGINPGSSEICGNGIDENCDGVDEICLAVCTDQDSDGYAREGGGCGPIDCNDNAASGATINPGATEVCDGVDNNCNGAIDEDCDCLSGQTRSCGSDVGECAVGLQTCLAGSWGSCVGEINPSAEVCDGKDNNCDGTVDEGCNKDTDTYCDCSRSFTYGSDLSAVCPGTNTTNAAAIANTCDCNDSNSGVNPGQTEICDNGEDDDCDGYKDCNDSGCSSDPACLVCVSDGSCDNNCPAGCGPADDPDCSGSGCCGDSTCNSGENSTSCPGDCPVSACSDGTAFGQCSSSTGAPWYCNSSGALIEDCNSCGCSGAWVCGPSGSFCCDNQCNNICAPAGCTASQDPDCSASGCCGDGQCDAGESFTDCPSDCPLSCADSDNDGHYAIDPVRCPQGDDCNDLLPAGPYMYPGNAETCDNIDNNCNDNTDEGCDDDDDYYCDANMLYYYNNMVKSGVDACPLSYNLTGFSGDDCDDNPAACGSACNPGQAEVCDGYDNNCNRTIDEGNPGGGVACNTGQPGICAQGTMVCRNGALECQADVIPAPENNEAACGDNNDNDCDNLVDCDDSDCDGTNVCIPCCSFDISLPCEFCPAGVSGPAGPPASPPLADSSPPVIISFTVTLGSAIISWTAQDAGGSFLDRIEIWRAPDNGGKPGAWSEVTGLRQLIASQNRNNHSGTVTDYPPAGTYWYGLHVFDRAGNVTYEPNPPGSAKIVVPDTSPPPPPPPSAQGKVYYVSPSGSAAWVNCMNRNTPCSVRTALDNASAGDTALFLDGIYDFSSWPIPSTYQDARLDAANKGNTIDGYITFKAENMQRATLMEGGPFGKNDSYVIWDGFRMVKSDNIHGISVRVFSNDHVILRNSFIPADFYNDDCNHNIDTIRISGTNNVTIQNNNIEAWNGALHRGNCTAIKVYRSNNLTIEYNTVRGYNGNAGMGIYLHKSGQGTLNENYVIRYNLVYDIPGGPCYEFRTVESDAIKNFQFYNNIGENCKNGIYHDGDTGNPAQDILIYNNTMRNINTWSSYQIDTAGTPTPNWSVWNNISVSSPWNYAGPTPDYSDYSAAWNTNYFFGSQSLADWKSAYPTLDQHSQIVNPNLNDDQDGKIEASDYRLQASSPEFVKTGGRGGTYASYIGALPWPADPNFCIGFQPNGISRCTQAGGGH